MSVAETILAQLGGSRFQVMTGASSFSSGKFSAGEGLTFRLPRAKHRIDAVRVILGADDLYQVEFLRRLSSLTEEPSPGYFGCKLVSKVEGVFCDRLREIFETETGLATTLGAAT